MTGSSATRLDRALLVDLRAAVDDSGVRVFLGLEIAAAAIVLVRRGPGLAGTLALLWLGLGILAFLAWWAGRHRAAVEVPDPVPRATVRTLVAGIGAVGLGLAMWGMAPAAGIAIALGAIVAWLATALRGAGAADRLLRQLLRDPRPFLPILLLIALPRAIAGGPGYAVEALLALPSGIFQQVALLIGLFAPLEALLGRTDRAAVATAVVFGLLHVPMDLPQAEGDLLVALANAMVFQATIGAIACLAFVRHRAALPLGVAHALAIA